MKIRKTWLAALALAWATATLGQPVPWVTMTKPGEAATLTLIGTAHSALYVREDIGRRLAALIDGADALYFEAADGFFSPNRRWGYRFSSTKFVGYDDLVGTARLCALAVQLASPARTRTTMDVGPVILRALLFDSSVPGVWLPQPGSGEVFDIAQPALARLAVDHARRVLEAETTGDWINFAARFDKAFTNDALQRVCLASQRPPTRARLQDKVVRLRSLVRAAQWDEALEVQRELDVVDLDMPARLFGDLTAYRNLKMLSRVLDGRSRRNVVLVVGGAHLGGPEGMLALLRARGYVRVTP